MTLALAGRGQAKNVVGVDVKGRPVLIADAASRTVTAAGVFVRRAVLDLIWIPI